MQDRDFTVISAARKAAKDVRQINLPDPRGLIDEVYASDVLTLDKLQSRLSKTVFKSLQATVERGEKLDAGIADTVALAMKSWAMERGATHYTHWFQPLTGSTAGETMLKELFSFTFANNGTKKKFNCFTCFTNIN